MKTARGILRACGYRNVPRVVAADQVPRMPSDRVLESLTQVARPAEAFHHLTHKPKQEKSQEKG